MRRRVAAAWAGFRVFRRVRPFWAGVFTLLSGLLLLFPPYASLKFGDVVVSLNTLTGITALIIGIVLVACAISLWFRPQFRMVAGIVTVVLALIAIVTANLGTFLLGTLFGVIGGALAIAWSPTPKVARRRGLIRRRIRGESRETAPKTSSESNWGSSAWGGEGA